MSLQGQIREYLAAKGGQADLGEIYHQQIGDTCNKVKIAVRELRRQGHVHNEGHLVVLTKQMDPGSAPARLWRAAHQLVDTKRAFNRDQLAQLAEVNKRNAREWILARIEAGHLVRLRAGLFRLASTAPHRNQPPAHRWARRGKSKAKQDRK